MNKQVEDWNKLGDVYPIADFNKVALTRKVREFVEAEQRAGKASRLRGWSMAEIAAKARQRFGPEAEAIVRQIILKECGLK